MNKLISIILFLACSSCMSYSDNTQKQTIASVNVEHINMGILESNTLKDSSFIITNMGDSPLLIQNIETSCGCTTPHWTKEPIRTGKSGTIRVTYNAEYPGHFHKTITVFANIANSPLSLSLSGNVEYPDVNKQTH